MIKKKVLNNKTINQFFYIMHIKTKIASNRTQIGKKKMFKTNGESCFINY